MSTNSLFFIEYACCYIYRLFKTHCLGHFGVMCMFVILLVLCLLVIQCGRHWSQLKATYLLTYLLTYIGALERIVQRTSRFAKCKLYSIS